jgi:hypothetical protein
VLICLAGEKVERAPMWVMRQGTKLPIDNSTHA